MSAVQKEYGPMKPTPEPTSIWLVVDFDPRGSFDDDNDLEKLREDLESAARELVNSRIDPNRRPGPGLKYHSGITATKKLEVTERLR